MQWAVTAVGAAGQLGAPVIRIDPLTADRALPAEVVRERFVRRVAELLDQTAGVEVDLGIENHGPIANDPSFLDAVFASLPDPRLGLTLDTGNFYWFGFALGELYQLIDRYAPRARHTHLKNINYPADLANRKRDMGIDYGKYCCSLDEGNIDLHRVIRSLHRRIHARSVYRERIAWEASQARAHGNPAARSRLGRWRDARVITLSQRSGQATARPSALSTCRVLHGTMAAMIRRPQFFFSHARVKSLLASCLPDRADRSPVRYRVATVLWFMLLGNLLLAHNAPHASAGDEAALTSYPWLAPYFGPRRHDIDATSLHHKVLCGYQGWFRCPGDGTDNGWRHWSRDPTRIAPETLTFDLWPDLSEYTNEEKFPAPGFKHPGAVQAYLFSSANPKTIDRHFDWMAQYGIDGVFVQRFVLELQDPPAASRVLAYCRNSATAPAGLSRLPMT